MNEKDTSNILPILKIREIEWILSSPDTIETKFFSWESIGYLGNIQMFSIVYDTYCYTLRTKLPGINIMVWKYNTSEQAKIKAVEILKDYIVYIIELNKK